MAQNNLRNESGMLLLMTLDTIRNESESTYSAKKQSYSKVAEIRTCDLGLCKEPVCDPYRLCKCERVIDLAIGKPFLESVVTVKRQAHIPRDQYRYDRSYNRYYRTLKTLFACKKPVTDIGTYSSYNTA